MQPAELAIPLLGKIAAGQPIEAVHDNETVNVTNLYLSPGRYALVKVTLC